MRKNVLLHRETLLVVATSDLENVSLELVADAVALDFLSNALLKKDMSTTFIINLNQLLCAVGRVGDVELDEYVSFVLRHSRDTASDK